LHAHARPCKQRDPTGRKLGTHARAVNANVRWYSCGRVSGLTPDRGLRDETPVLAERPCKYTGTFDEVFGSGGIRLVETPVRAPQANAIAERFVRTIRAECLDWLMIVNRRHLDRVLRVYIDHYNVHRLHRALKLQPPQPREPPPVPTTGEIERRDRLGGLIHEYYRAAA
jgi:Integrase core domain